MGRLFFSRSENDAARHSAAARTSGAAARTSASTCASNLAKFLWNMPTSARGLVERVLVLPGVDHIENLGRHARQRGWHRKEEILVYGPRILARRVPASRGRLDYQSHQTANLEGSDVRRWNRIGCASLSLFYSLKDVARHARSPLDRRVLHLVGCLRCNSVLEFGGYSVEVSASCFPDI
jgi:hypothetical protein